jgi:cell division protein FtsL
MSLLRLPELWLAILLVLSALAVSWSVHEARRLTNEVQRLQAEHNRLQTEWGQLLLEHSTWGAYARVERMARDKLAMSLPDASRRVVVKP